MKRILSLALALSVIFCCMAGCGAKKKDRVLYSDIKLSKYVELGKYKGVPVDTSSKTHKEYTDEILESDVTNNSLYVKKTEGTVADGDVTNIDYVGKKDGVAFDGGTAEGYDLEIGSDSFIDGFEDGLIGVQIGSTVDLNLTFPESYGNSELAGKPVVFTVKVNYVVTDEKREPSDYYKDLDFNSLEEYEADVKERAIRNYLLDTVTANSKVKDYPKDDREFLNGELTKTIESNIQSQYGVDLETYLSYASQTKEQFEEELFENQIKALMDNQLVIYAILDKEEMEFTSNDTDKLITKTVNDYGDMSITADTLKDYYGEYYFESIAVSEKVMDFIYKNAKIS